MLTPMLASAADVLPVGTKWTYEIKWDGYRALALKEGASIRLISRNQKNLTADYPHSRQRGAVKALQHRSTTGLAIAYVAFDVLMVGQTSLTAEPLSNRRARLSAVLSGSGVMPS